MNKQLLTAIRDYLDAVQAAYKAQQALDNAQQSLKAAEYNLHCEMEEQCYIIRTESGTFEIFKSNGERVKMEPVTIYDIDAMGYEADECAASRYED